MKTKLVVTGAFSLRVGEGEARTVKDYPVGAEITDAADMKAVRASHPHHVVATAATAPDPEADRATPDAKASALTGEATARDKTS